MSKSLLLHSLSLKDRILEPNKLPLNGQVWAYNKAKYSKEEFVGNCITMLSFLGMQNARIQWKEDILAFDTQWQNKTYTIVISLQDDSLASDYYYFLGIWECPEGEKAPQQSAGFHKRFAAITPWEDEDLIKPDIAYSVTVASEPLQLPELKKAIGDELFGQSIFSGDYYLCGTTSAGAIHSGKFVISPVSTRFNHAKHNIKHALYSLRNMMALMGKAIAIHDETLADPLFVELQKQQRLLSNSPLAVSATAVECGELSRQYGENLLKACNLLGQDDQRQKELQSIELLFDSISTELVAVDSGAFRPLFHRMKLPFKHAQTLIGEHSSATSHFEKQVQILRQTLQSQMLASQLRMLETLIGHQEKGH